MHTSVRYHFIFLVLLFVSGASLSASSAPPRLAAIATAHHLATEAGRLTLENGGNAFDAAVAISAALAVVEPYSSGLGGGGFWLLHRGSDGFETLIDGRETAPAHAFAARYLDSAGALDRNKSLNTPLAAGIWGVPAALAHISRRYGKLPIAESLRPAIRYAHDGVVVTPRYQKMAEYRFATLAHWPESRRLFLANGKVPSLGQRLLQPELAETLTRLADEGETAFYQGAFAAHVVREITHDGGVWQMSDLERYRVIERTPITFSYRGIRVVSAPPPSSGGLLLSQMLALFDQFPDVTEQEKRHLLIEVMRRGYRDRAFLLGDPDFISIPYARFMDSAVINKLAEGIDLTRATPLPIPENEAQRPVGTNTTHFSVMDGEGNWVSATLSINLPFGSGYAVPQTGVLLNNEMDDFAIQALVPNRYGLIGQEANAILPGKRPLSSMSPTFLENKERAGLLGTPGGSRIISMVLLGILEFADGKPPSDWVALPRFHHQYSPDEVLHEPGAFTAHEKTDLRARGHALRNLGRDYGNMQAISWDKVTRTYQAASDPRGEGSSCVFAY